MQAGECPECRQRTWVYCWNMSRRSKPFFEALQGVK